MAELKGYAGKILRVDLSRDHRFCGDPEPCCASSWAVRRWEPTIC